MAASKRRGRPAGEVQVGVGFDEKLKRLAELFREKAWSFTSEGGGTINADALQTMAASQEADAQADRDAWSRYQQVHGPVMARQGQRGATFSSALAFARTAARGNRELLKLVNELKVRRSPGRPAVASSSAPGAP